MDGGAGRDGAPGPGHGWWAAAGVLLVGAAVLVVAAAGLPASPPPRPVVVLGAADRTDPVVDRLATRGQGLAAPADPAPPAGLPRSTPVRLDIDVIGVHTRLMTLGLAPDGTVEVPPLRSDAPAGWYDGGAAPGQAGPAVLLGHVDTARSGPAVFYRLGALRAGDLVRVTRADGRVVRFRVSDVVLAPKDAFPTAAVYGPTSAATLRLVTCGGSFDRRTRSYRDNTIVFATVEA